MTADGSSPIGVTDARVVVIGAGVAGLSAALTLARGAGGAAPLAVTVLADSQPGAGGSTRWAQGGVAAAMGDGDTTVDHASDTVAAGSGLVAHDVALMVTGDAPDAIDWLTSLGAQFDRDESGKLVLGREAAHGAHRIVHSRDATGAELARALAQAAAGEPGITVLDGVAIDLIRSVEQAGEADGVVRIAGVLARRSDGSLEAIRSDAVVLATGGYAHLWAATTTPAQAVGDGVAMAARAGVEVVDMEFVQFHPTAMAGGGDPMPLLTEALRGEGAVLVNELGERFCFAEHPDGELAPRDVVARANYNQMIAGHTTYLDATVAVGDDFPDRFPTVFALAMAYGVDPRICPVAVSPAAHYCMGGISVDNVGRTSVPGLWGAGEVASNGLHGANRLASNSLLEGVVTGRRVAVDIFEALANERGDEATGLATTVVPLDASGNREADPNNVVQAVRELLWHRAGLLRNAADLRAGLQELAQLRAKAPGSRPARNAVLVATLVLEAALRRTESRGAHFRTDFPNLDPTQAQRVRQHPNAVAAVPLGVSVAKPRDEYLLAAAL